MTFPIFLWLFSISMSYLNSGEKLALLYGRCAYVGIIFIPATIYHFTVTFLGLKNQKKFVLLSYIIAAIFLILSGSIYFISGVKRYFFGYYAKAGPIHPLFLTFFATMLAISIYDLYRGYKEGEIGSITRIRIKYMFWGILMASFGAVDFLPHYGVKIYPFGFAFIIITILISSFAIVKYRLLDIETFAYRTLGYATLSFIILTSYVGVFTLIPRVFHVKLENPLFMGLMLLAFLFIFIGIKDSIWNLLGHLFYRDKYKYRETLNEFAKRLNIILDLEELLSTIVGTVTDTIHIDKVSIMVLDEEGKEYFVYGTPWPGEGEIASSQKAPLKKINFLFKDNENTLIPLGKKEALRKIVTQCFPALWDRESIGFAMEFCGALSEDIPSFRFGFVPDESAVEFIENKFTYD